MAACSLRGRVVVAALISVFQTTCGQTCGPGEYWSADAPPSDACMNCPEGRAQSESTTADRASPIASVSALSVDGEFKVMVATPAAVTEAVTRGGGGIERGFVSVAENVAQMELGTFEIGLLPTISAAPALLWSTARSKRCFLALRSAHFRHVIYTWACALIFKAIGSLQLAKAAR